MSDIWGVAIPGLSMAAAELPKVAGLKALDNPEVGEGHQWERESYSLDDIAAWHVDRIKDMGLTKLTVIGMSMGGMVVSIMASRFRGELPRDTSFRVLVSSPSLKTNPALTREMLIGWRGARPGSTESYAAILRPFFSDRFVAQSPEVAWEYYRYRASGENKQPAMALLRQISAMSNYDGSQYWPHINPAEMTVIGGGDDKILGPTHFRDIQALLPDARHIEISDLGHMANIEAPDLFQRSPY